MQCFYHCLEYYEISCMPYSVYIRSHIISQKDLFQTLDWRYEASKNMLLNVVFSRAFRWSSIYYTEP